jgi:hypothetical protein
LAVAVFFNSLLDRLPDDAFRAVRVAVLVLLFAVLAAVT